MRVDRDGAREQRREKDEEQARDRDQAHGAREQRAHARVAARREHGRVPRQDDDQDQRRAGADGVDRDQECDLAVDLGAEHASSDRVVDKTADAGDEPAEEQDEVLADEAVLNQLGQPLAWSQSLHVPRILKTLPG